MDVTIFCYIILYHTKINIILANKIYIGYKMALIIAIGKMLPTDQVKLSYLS